MFCVPFWWCIKPMKRCVVSNRGSSNKLIWVLYQLLCSIPFSVSSVVCIVTISGIKRRRSSVRVTGKVSNLWRKIVLIPRRFGYIDRLFSDKVALAIGPVLTGRWYEIGVQIVGRFVHEKRVVVEPPSCHQLVNELTEKTYTWVFFFKSQRALKRTLGMSGRVRSTSFLVGRMVEYDQEGLE